MLRTFVILSAMLLPSVLFAEIRVQHSPNAYVVARAAYQARLNQVRQQQYLPSRGSTYVVPVQGYFRADGAYVPPHYRTVRDGYRSNNWSSYPNVNPYTGRPGYGW